MGDLSVQHEAATEAYKTWNNLSDNERLIFEDIAKGNSIPHPFLLQLHQM